MIVSWVLGKQLFPSFGWSGWQRLQSFNMRIQSASNLLHEAELQNETKALTSILFGNWHL